MAQFKAFDAIGSLNRGEQFAQQQALRPIQLDSAKQKLQLGTQQLNQGVQTGQFNKLKIENMRQSIDQRNNDQKNADFVGSALMLQQLPDDQLLGQLQKNRVEIIKKGGDSSDTDLGIKLAQEGNFEELRLGINNIVTLGERQGIIKPLTPKKLSSLQQKVEAEGLDPFTAEGQARAREITQGSRTDPSLKPSDQQILNKANEGQLASASFAARVLSANKNLTELENTPGFDPTSIQTAFFEALPGGNIALSEKQQSYAQSKRDFITAILRKESGAAIGKDEFVNEDIKFFPQFGDKPKVLKQKSLGRKRTFENLKNQSKGVFDVQNKSKAKTGALSKSEQAELKQLRSELGQ